MSKNDLEKDTTPSESQGLARAQVDLLALIAEIAIQAISKSEREVTEDHSNTLDSKKI